MRGVVKKKPVNEQDVYDKEYYKSRKKMASYHSFYHNSEHLKLSGAASITNAVKNAKTNGKLLEDQHRHNRAMKPSTTTTGKDIRQR